MHNATEAKTYVAASFSEVGAIDLMCLFISCCINGGDSCVFTTRKKNHIQQMILLFGRWYFQVNGKLLKLQRILKSGFDIFGRYILKLNLWLQLLNFQQRHSCWFYLTSNLSSLGMHIISFIGHHELIKFKIFNGKKSFHWITRFARKKKQLFPSEWLLLEYNKWFLVQRMSRSFVLLAERKVRFFWSISGLHSP